MEMIKKEYKDYSVEELVLDKQFTLWVLHPDRQKDAFWKNFIETYPEKKSEVIEAARIIRSFHILEDEVPEEKLHSILDRILREKRPSIFPLMRAAAVLLTMLAISSIFYLLVKMKPHWPLIPEQELTDNVRVILPDGSTIESPLIETKLRQTGKGDLLVNQDTVKQIDVKEADGNSRLEQLLVPYGKRSEVVLSDGSRVWLNSGSRFAYPVLFGKDYRKVFLTGEAYFEVTPDNSKPFVVVTRDLKIRVLGTAFNVSAYDDDLTIQTLVTRGKVSVAKNAFLASDHDLNPGDRISFNKEEGTFVQGKVNADEAISWVHGYFVFKNEPADEIIKKLTRYYNQPIVAANGLENLTFSGKLDLKKDLHEVLDAVAFASSLKVEYRNGQYVVAPKSEQ